MRKLTPEESREAAQEVCDRHGFTLIDVMPNRSMASFVAIVSNGQGAVLTLKAHNPRRLRREIRSNQRWSQVGAATFAAEVEPGVMAREFADGVPLKELPCGGARYGREIGELLAKMHSVKVDGDSCFKSARGYIEKRSRSHLANYRFPRGQYRIVRKAVDDLLASDLGNELTHGDFCAGNVLVANHRLFAFDARGLVGGGALDLVNFSLWVRRADPIKLLAEVVDGYGRMPKGLAATFAWRLIVKAQSDGYSSSRLRDLAEQIAEARDYRIVEKMLRDAGCQVAIQAHEDEKRGHASDDRGRAFGHDRRDDGGVVVHAEHRFDEDSDSEDDSDDDDEVDYGDHRRDYGYGDRRHSRRHR